MGEFVHVTRQSELITLRWLLAEARWWALIWSLEAIDHGGGLDWWAGPFPWDTPDGESAT